MKKALFVVLSIVLVVIGLSACQAAPDGPQLEVSEMWGRPSPLVEGNGAAYMAITNTGNEDDKLINAYSDVAENVELHDMTMENDVMKMFRVDYMDIPAGGKLELAPGGKHVMFIGLYQPLEVGQVVTVELEFEKSGKQTIQVEVKEQ